MNTHTKRSPGGKQYFKKTSRQFDLKHQKYGEFDIN